MKLFHTISRNKVLYSTLFILLTLSGVLFSYQYLFQTYFAMDEWSFWMEYLRYGPYSMIKAVGIIGALTGATRVGLYFTNDIYFRLFGLDIRPWHYTFFFLHLANVFFLYVLLRKLKISPLSAFLGSFYFGIASAGQEGLSWPAAGIPVLGFTLFLLISALLTDKFNQSKKFVFLIYAVVCSYISFLFRPTGIVVPALILVLVFLFYKRSRTIRLPRIVLYASAVAVALGIFRVILLYWGRMGVLLKAGFDIIFYPVVTLSHIFIPYRLMFRLSDGFINFFYPIIAKDGNVQTISHLVVGDFISVMISLVILFFIFLLFKWSNPFNKKVLVFGLIAFTVQYVPIALNYPDRGGLSYLESRHMYASIVGISVLLGVLFDFVLSQFKTKNLLKKYLVLIVFLLVGVWFFKEMAVTRREVRVQAIEDTAIKKTFYSLRSLKLPNSNKMVFYVRSDRSYYYPDWYLPFKLPASYMLPLAFYGRPFIDKSELGELESNNIYKDSNNKQFGYFTDITTLATLVKQGKIDITSVVGLHFIDGSYTFEDTTPQTRKMIESEQ